MTHNGNWSNPALSEKPFSKRQSFRPAEETPKMTPPEEPTRPQSIRTERWQHSRFAPLYRHPPQASGCFSWEADSRTWESCTERERGGKCQCRSPGSPQGQQPARQGLCLAGGGSPWGDAGRPQGPRLGQLPGGQEEQQQWQEEAKGEADPRGRAGMKRARTSPLAHAAPGKGRHHPPNQELAKGAEKRGSASSAGNRLPGPAGRAGT